MWQARTERRHFGPRLLPRVELMGDYLKSEPYAKCDKMEAGVLSSTVVAGRSCERAFSRSAWNDWWHGWTDADMAEKEREKRF